MLVHEQGDMIGNKNLVIIELDTCKKRLEQYVFARPVVLLILLYLQYLLSPMPAIGGV